jgi:hypothetical protein
MERLGEVVVGAETQAADPVLGGVRGVLSTAVYASTKGWTVVVPTVAWTGGLGSAVLRRRSDVLPGDHELASVAGVSSA